MRHMVATALLSAGLVGGVLASPAAADHTDYTGYWGGESCHLDWMKHGPALGFFASAHKVTGVKVGKPKAGDVSVRYDAYTCHFEGLPSYADGEEYGTGEYFAPTAGPVTYKISCMAAETDAGSPDYNLGRVMIFKNGTALMHCGRGLGA